MSEKETTGKTRPAITTTLPQTPDRPLLTDVRQMITQARESVARAELKAQLQEALTR